MKIDSIMKHLNFEQDQKAKKQKKKQTPGNYQNLHNLPSWTIPPHINPVTKVPIPPGYETKRTALFRNLLKEEGKRIQRTESLNPRPPTRARANPCKARRASFVFLLRRDKRLATSAITLLWFTNTI